MFIWNACHLTAEKIMTVWAKALIPIRLKKHVISKVEKTFRELKKNKESKAFKWNQTEDKWKVELEDLFDIIHAKAVNLIDVQEITVETKHKMALDTPGDEHSSY